MALGMVPSDLFEGTIEDQTVPFETDDLLVLFTDGVTEAENEEKEEFGIARLCETLSSSFSSKANVFNRKLLCELDDYSSDSFERDDLTIVTVKRV